MSMNYNNYPITYQYGTQAVEPWWDYTDDYIEADSSVVNAQQFWGFGPFFGGPFWGGPFFGGPYFGRPFFGPYWGWRRRWW